MFKKKKTSVKVTQVTKAAVPNSKLRDEWKYCRFSDKTRMKIFLVNDFVHKQGGKQATTENSVYFGGVEHLDPNFEAEWTKLLEKAKRRCDFLNGNIQDAKAQETADKIEHSVCASCSNEFEGEDYLCPGCRERDKS